MSVDGGKVNGETNDYRSHVQQDDVLMTLLQLAAAGACDVTAPSTNHVESFIYATRSKAVWSTLFSKKVVKYNKSKHNKQQIGVIIHN